jgi:hypothetical protein
MDSDIAACVAGPDSVFLMCGFGWCGVSVVVREGFDSCNSVFGNGLV